MVFTSGSMLFTGGYLMVGEMSELVLAFFFLFSLNNLIIYNKISGIYFYECSP